MSYIAEVIADSVSPEGQRISPLEHPARPMFKEELKKSKFNGNIRGWWQHRSDVSGSENFQTQQELEPFIQEQF